MDEIVYWITTTTTTNMDKVIVPHPDAWTRTSKVRREQNQNSWISL